MKTIVVGAGAGGLASALLAGLRGEEVTVLEAHSYLGGCASYFTRGPFVFDAGATTLSGVLPHEPLGRLFQELGSVPKLRRADPGIVFHLSTGRKVSYHQDFDRWMEELAEKFPALPQRAFWSEVREINNRSWNLLRDIGAFPFQRAGDVLRSVRYFPLLKELLVSTDLRLKGAGLESAEYREMIEGILIISAQAGASDIPFLVGAMALSYPAETYVPVGGMKGFMDYFEEECGKRNVRILKRARVTAFGEDAGSARVTLADGQVLSADRLIMNLPLWNLARLDEGRGKRLKAEARERPGHWGAFTVYLGTKSQVTESYHQVHLNHPLVKNYFASFSLVDDRSRAPEGWQAVTISTHTPAQEWAGLGEGEYEARKAQLQDLILDDFLPRFGVGEHRFLSSGTPRTFERYTGRSAGFVGGLPFLYGSNPFRIPGARTGYRNVFRVGDTTFPGQGVCGVVAGALGLHHLLRKEP